MAVTILRKNDRVKVKIDELIIEVAPLTQYQKNDIRTNAIKDIKNKISKENIDINSMMRLTLKHSIKDIIGVNDIDGNKYELEFEDTEKTALTDNCIDEIMTLQEHGKINLFLMEWINGVPKDGKIYDPSNPKKIIEGVEVIFNGKKPVRKKATRKRKK